MSSDVRSYHGSARTPASVGMPPGKQHRFCVRCQKQVAATGGKYLAPGMFVGACCRKPPATPVGTAL